MGQTTRVSTWALGTGITLGLEKKRDVLRSHLGIGRHSASDLQGIKRSFKLHGAQSCVVPDTLFAFGKLFG